MTAAAPSLTQETSSVAVLSDAAEAQGNGRVVDALEFQALLVSHRRMARLDRREDRVRGLQDLDTGEVFYIDERRLFNPR